jgi:hypothetical protein
MSGLEIAGVLLGAAPLIISTLEHWRNIAKVGGFYWQVQREYKKCRREVRLYNTLYRQNLKELLLPIVDDAADLSRLLSDPGGKEWGSKALQERLEGRLQDSYETYMETICEMNEMAEELRKELALDKASVQDKLASPRPKKRRRLLSPQPPSKLSRLAINTKWDYETFRLKFSLSEPVRKQLFEQLTKCNERLEKLLSTSDRISALESAPSSTRRTEVLGMTLKKAWRKSDLLFKALEKAWRCSCQEYHFANLRLEHRTAPEICFELILLTIAPSAQANASWSWRELQCGAKISCSSSQQLGRPSVMVQLPQCLPSQAPAPSLSTISVRRKKVAFKMPASAIPETVLGITIDPTVKLCQALGNRHHGTCIGIIGYEDETYHLHPSTKRGRLIDNGPLTLNRILSNDFEGHPTRRQRYFIALLLASSTAQLQFTPWLHSGLTKEDILFFPCVDDSCTVPFHEPFIRQGFSLPHHRTLDNQANDCNFYWLGILLLELCFGRRLEEHPLCKKHAGEAGEAKKALNLVAALTWSHSVREEGGNEYASAVQWCFSTTAKETGQFWQGEIIKNVITPLEKCLKYFEMVDDT